MKNEFRTTGSTGLTECFASSAQRVVTIDVARYQSYLDGMDASDERKEEILRAMFSIVMTFVDLGFSVHPLQQLDGQEPCGKDEKSGDQRPKVAFDRVRSEAILKLEPKNRTGPDGRLELK